MELIEEEVPNSTKFIVTCLKRELTDKFNLNENHQIKILVFETRPKLSIEEVVRRRIESNKRTKEKYKEKIREKAVAYYYKNREKRIEYCKQYYQTKKAERANKETVENEEK